MFNKTLNYTGYFPEDPWAITKVYSVIFHLSFHLNFLASFILASQIDGSSGKKKNPPAHAGDLSDTSLIPGLRRYPGGGHGNPLQYSCLENPMDRGA